MTTLIIVSYCISCVVFFFFLTKSRKKVWGYLDKEDLFWLLFGSAIYPAVVIGYIIYKIFDWLEVFIND